MKPEQRKPATYSAEPIPYVGQTIAIASGKGGVGKSTTAVCLAHALVARGKRVGILDADIHGPSVPRMLGVLHSGQPEQKDGQLLPICGHGIKSMSMGSLSGDKAAIWRGPMVSKALVQMLRYVRWGTQAQPLDVLLIDMPPGTGDIHLSLMQQAPLDGALIVTTPQEIAVADAEKAAQMFVQIGVPILGIIENMSWFEALDGTKHALFGAGGGERLSKLSGAPLLAQLPQNPALQQAVDCGNKPENLELFEKITAKITK